MRVRGKQLSLQIFSLISAGRDEKKVKLDRGVYDCILAAVAIGKCGGISRSRLSLADGRASRVWKQLANMLKRLADKSYM